MITYNDFHLMTTVRLCRVLTTLLMFDALEPDDAVRMMNGAGAAIAQASLKRYLDFDELSDDECFKLFG